MAFISRQVRIRATSRVRAVLVCLLILIPVTAQAQSGVEIQPTPENGLQPRLMQDSTGNVHLLYFRKRASDPRAREGDLFYRQYDGAALEWGPARRVSSQSYTHADPIYRANFSLDGEGRVHVVWYTGRPTAFFYTRSNLERSEFEPQRSMVSENLIGIDAGADIAAQGSSVAISWAAGDLTKEAERTVYTRVSQDYGASFSTEIQIGDTAMGACACCSLAVEFDQADQLLVAYRSAIDGIGRHMQLLQTNLVETTKLDGDERAEFNYAELDELQKWELSACPVSTNDFSKDFEANNWLVFETESRVVQMNTSTGSKPALVADPLTRTRQKNPDIAFSRDGYKLIVWAEGISFTRGGTLNWQLFDAQDNPVNTEEKQQITIQDNSSPAVAVTPAGSFLILY